MALGQRAPANSNGIASSGAIIVVVAGVNVADAVWIDAEIMRLTGLQLRHVHRIRIRRACCNTSEAASPEIRLALSTSANQIGLIAECSACRCRIRPKSNASCMAYRGILTNSGATLGTSFDGSVLTNCRTVVTQSPRSLAQSC
ncbi:hypothetical protein D9M69_557110 [compost metagenome]